MNTDVKITVEEIMKCEKMRKLLETLSETMSYISALWDENEDCIEIMSEYYPESLISFDELTSYISDWVDKATYEIKEQELIYQYQCERNVWKKKVNDYQENRW